MGEFERVRWTVLENILSGEKVVIDGFQIRLQKMRQRIGAWAQLAEMWRAENPCRLVMVLLTYAKGDDWESGHIRYYLKSLKQKLGDQLWGWAWVAEMQVERAEMYGEWVVHYHLVAMVENGTDFPMPDKSGMWPHGWSGTRTARSAFYLVKYVGKERQKDLTKFPKGCRLYGSSFRVGGEGMRLMWRNLSGLSGEKIELNNEWIFRGAAVTEGYARRVLAGERIV